MDFIANVFKLSYILLSSTIFTKNASFMNYITNKYFRSHTDTPLLNEKRCDYMILESLKDVIRFIENSLDTFNVPLKARIRENDKLQIMSISSIIFVYEYAYRTPPLLLKFNF